MPCLSEQDLIDTYGPNWADKLTIKGQYSSLEDCQVPCGGITNRRYIEITFEGDSPCGIGLITHCQTVEGNPPLTNTWRSGGCGPKPIDNSPYLSNTLSGNWQPGPTYNRWTFDLKIAREGENSYPALLGTNDTLDIDLFAVWYGAYVSRPINIYLKAVHNSDRFGNPDILLDTKMNVALAHPQGWVGGCEGGTSEPNGGWLSICKRDSMTGAKIDGPYDPFKVARIRIFPGILASFI